MQPSSLRIVGVEKSFGGLRAVSNLSMELAAGSVIGLIGPNGAGKSTLVNLITGTLPVTGGRVYLGERDITALPPHEVVRAGVARTFQNIRLARMASAAENVTAGFHRRESATLIENVLGLPRARRERRELRAKAVALMNELGIAEFADMPAGQLAYGHQRKVEIARALATSPDYLLLDEPVAGMNQVEAEELGRLVVKLAESGIGVLLIEHNMEFVLRICSKLYVLNSGALIAEGPAHEVIRAPAVVEAYLGA
jgi:branched-chain amino acid transport system ATP-binding protein